MLYQFVLTDGTLEILIQADTKASAWKHLARYMEREVGRVVATEELQNVWVAMPVRAAAVVAVVGNVFVDGRPTRDRLTGNARKARAS